MRRHKAAKPVTSGEMIRLQDVGFGRLDNTRSIPSDSTTQYDIAARVLAERFGLPLHRAVLVCERARIGGGRQ